ncbi:MAG: hypothetical protein KAX38_09170, partial [Candidatus Krumholzibacteria bacterium]|nr:hypothetical protein [Candidatus Krumholzibacteria bacterium]
PDSKLVEKWLEDISCPQRIVSQICKELNMPFLDLFPAFVENSKKALYIPSEGHFSKNGHAVVARRLVDFITENAE